MFKCPVCGKETSQILREEEGRNWKLYLGYAQFILPTLKENFSALITDPPYNHGGMKDRRPPSSKYAQTGSKYLETVPEFAGEGLSDRAWTDMLLTVFQSSYKLLKPNSPVFVFTSWQRINDVAEMLALSGFRVRSVIVWDKTRASRPVKGGFRFQTEFILWAVKGKPTKEVCLDGIVRCRPVQGQNKLHITQKPVEVIEFLLQAVEEGGHVLDPFAGSASTGEACIRNDFKFTGIEVVPEVYETAVKRLRSLE